MHNRVGREGRARARSACATPRARPARAGDPGARASTRSSRCALRARPSATRRRVARRSRGAAAGAAGRRRRGSAARGAAREPSRRRARQGPAHRLGGALAAARAARRRAASCCSSGCCRGRVVRERGVPALTLVALGAVARPDDLAVATRRKSIISGALRGRRPRAALTSVRRPRLRGRGALAGARARRARPAHGEYHALLLDLDRRHGRARRGAEPGHAVPRVSSCCRSRSTCCARPSCAASSRWSPA